MSKVRNSLKISKYLLFFLINFSLVSFCLGTSADFSVFETRDNFLTLGNDKENEYVLRDFIFPLTPEFKNYPDYENKEIKEIRKDKGWVYTVKKGETLWQISKKFGIKIEDIVAFNELKENYVLKAGDKIYLPGVKPQAIVSLPLIKKFAGKFISAMTDLGGLVAPVSGFNWGEKHSLNATDIAAPCGSEVYAANSGEVIDSLDGWNGGYGNYIIIKHPNAVYTLYGHLSLRLVEVGESVEKGQLIGYVGNTGYTLGQTGCHLHFEVRGKTNPLLR